MFDRDKQRNPVYDAVFISADAFTLARPRPKRASRSRSRSSGTLARKTSRRKKPREELGKKGLDIYLFFNIWF